jgi:hypothetical protein
MSQDNTGKPSTQESIQASAHESTHESTPQPHRDQPIADVAQDEQGPQASISVATDDQAKADDLLHAAHAVPPADMVANVELTLDHLSTTVDLFDIPPFDYGDTGGADASV